jgi:hypothetical protein
LKTFCTASAWRCLSISDFSASIRLAAAAALDERDSICSTASARPISRVSAGAGDGSEPAGIPLGAAAYDAAAAVLGAAL